MLVQKICQIPDELFFHAKEEIDLIQWDQIVDPRANASVFNTSKAVHLRVHKPPVNGVVPSTVDEWSTIIDTIDNPYQIDKYPKVMNLAKWVYKTVNGVGLGRVMIIKVEPGGVVNPHVDPLTYFEVHSRFHIPIKTNPDVIFYNDQRQIGEHMPYKVLCRLNNRIIHAMRNDGIEDRIHLLVDVETSDGNQIF